MLARLLGVRPADCAAAWPGAAAALCVFFALSLLKPLREVSGIEHGSTRLNELWMGSFLATVIAVAAYWWWTVRCSPVRTVAWIHGVTALALIGLAVFLARGAELGRAFYVGYSVLNLLLVSTLWSLGVDVLRTEQARRVFGAIAAGGSLGALLGSAIASLTPHGVWLLIGAAVSLIAGVRFQRLWEQRARALLSMGTEQSADPGPLHSAFEGLQRFLRSPYLWGVAAFLLCVSLTSTYFYRLQLEVVEAAAQARDDRARWFATMNLMQQGLALLLQRFLVPRLLISARLRLALLLLPLCTVLCIGVLAAQPVLLALLLAQTARSSTQYGVDKPARELLFSVVGRAEKYQSKGMVDTCIHRGADVVAIGALDALQRICATPGGHSTLSATLAPVSAVFVVVCFLWMVLAIVLARQHKLRAEDRAGPPGRGWQGDQGPSLG